MKSRVLLLAFLLLAASGSAADYETAQPGYHFEFPHDFFSHPAYQTEWWYYTGNVRASDGRRFGFELTFFREGVSQKPKTSMWSVQELYMAHLAVTDIDGRHYDHAERINRAGPGIAGVDAAQGLIWNGNWQVHMDGSQEQLRAVADGFAIDLNLRAETPVVIQGQSGISRKAAGAGHASHYFSIPRLQVAGTIEAQGKEYPASGSAWMDHEFFTGSLASDESGWDWMGLQLNDGTELMLYRMRLRDGSADPCSSGSFVDAQGHSTFLSAGDFRMTPEGDAWTSPETGARYPLRWHVSIPARGLDLQVTTPLPEQEMTSRFGPSYWEGAVDMKGKAGDHAVQGAGYLEMTGYAAGNRNVLP